MRSYEKEVVDNLLVLVRTLADAGVDIRVEKYGTAIRSGSSYPLFRVVAHSYSKVSNFWCLTTAGVHGLEISGVHGTLDFMKKHLRSYLDRCNFVFYPCINPYGFEHDVRWVDAVHDEAHDANRQCFPGTSLPECRRFVESLGGKMKFDVSIDLHETMENDAAIMAEQYSDRPDPGYNMTPEGFYFWETCRQKDERIGLKILPKIAELVPLCTDETIFGDINNGGVIFYPEGCVCEDYQEGTTFDAFLEKNYTHHAFVTETHEAWGLPKRVQVQSTFISEVLNLKLMKRK